VSKRQVGTGLPTPVIVPGRSHYRKLVTIQSFNAQSLRSRHLGALARWRAISTDIRRSRKPTHFSAGKPRSGSPALKQHHLSIRILSGFQKVIFRDGEQQANTHEIHSWTWQGENASSDSKSRMRSTRYGCLPRAYMKRPRERCVPSEERFLNSCKWYRDGAQKTRAPRLIELCCLKFRFSLIQRS
jgi:hypothetical protein